MKRRFMMMSLLISGPKQPSNDIDVYLVPLIEELKALWDDGVEVFDSYLQENFPLRAILFCTINDFPAYDNLSGFRNKGAKACPICMEDTNSQWLSNCKKIVYLGHRRFLRSSHPYRRNKKAFDGKNEKALAPLPKSGKQIYGMVKDIKVCFGKKV
jgi:Transposase family tnp2